MLNLIEALHKSEAILFGCDKNGIIRVQEGGGLKLHGLRNRQFIGYNAFDVFGDLTDFLKALKNTLDGTPTVAMYKWGDDYCETQLIPMEDGGAVGVCTVQTKRVLEEKAKLIESKILAKSEAYNIHNSMIYHEIRNATSSISNVIDIIKSETSMNNQYIHLLENNAKLLITLMTDLMTISKLDNSDVKVEKIPYKLSDMITDVLTIFYKRAEEKKIDLTCMNCPNIKVMGDPHKVSQVITNFLSNAIKFTSNGKIELVVDVNPTLAEGDSVHLKFVVRDTGTGIDKDNIDKLFENYVQADISTSRLFGGTGLGLSICKKLVKLMDGEIGCHSEGKGKGSTFWFNIPTEICPKEGGYREIDLFNKKIMIVEDNITMQIILNKYLHKLGYTNIHICENGEMAWNRIHVDKDFEVLFIDNNMPIMNGRTLATKIKLNSSFHLFLVSMSADNDADMTLFDSKICKPFNIDEIKMVLDSLK